MNKIIITVAREFGSGGREFGRRLAEELKIEYYDKEILGEIAKRTALSENYVKQVIENTPHNLFPITVGQTLPCLENYTMSNIQSVFREQSNVITDMAEKSSCVIVGRCADYILRDLKPFRIYVYADMDSKIRRCAKHVHEGEIFIEKKMRKQLKKMDKGRAKFYNFYTGKNWGDKLNYDLCINTSNIDIKQTVKTIAKLFK